MPRFTKSRDGVERANLTIKLRVDRETLAEFNRRLRETHYPDSFTLQDYLRGTFWDGYHCETSRLESDRDLHATYGETDDD